MADQSPHVLEPQTNEAKNLDPLDFDGKVFKLLYLVNVNSNDSIEIRVGDKIAWSPVGSSVLTGITEAGYPMVNHVAVTCLITESGLVHSGVRDVIERSARKLNKKATFSYLHERKYYLEGTGPVPDTLFGQYPKRSYNDDFYLEWKITYVDKEVSSEEQKLAVRKENCLKIAQEALEGIFKEHYIDPDRDTAAVKITQVLANWIESYAQERDNCEFHHNIVIQIGEMFGQAAKTSDDGSIQEDVLALKVPELVEALIKDTKEYKNVKNSNASYAMIVNT